MLDTQTLIMYAYNQVNSEHCEANINHTCITLEKSFALRHLGVLVLLGAIALISK